jgi:hypothetical protein
MRVFLLLALLLCVSQAFAQASGGGSVPSPEAACLATGDQICLARYSAQRAYDAEVTAGPFQSFVAEAGPVLGVVVAAALGFMVSRVRFH